MTIPLLTLVNTYLVDKDDKDDDDEDYGEVTIDDKDIPPSDSVAFFNEMKADLIEEYLELCLSQLRSLDYKITIHEDDVEDGMIPVEVIAIEVDTSNISKFYQDLTQSLTPQDRFMLTQSLLNNDKSILLGLIDRVVQKSGNVYTTEKETSIYRFQLPHEINSLDDLNTLEQKIKDAVKRFEEILKDEGEEGFIEF